MVNFVNKIMIKRVRDMMKYTGTYITIFPMLLRKHLEYKDKTWDFNFDESKHRDGSYYHFIRTSCSLWIA